MFKTVARINKHIKEVLKSFDFTENQIWLINQVALDLLNSPE